ncbi:MAG: 16S rRNA (guanine(527)-N(7))-methyltransferase RsmG [Sneathiella sp.]
MTKNEFIRNTGVSRETSEKLEKYVFLLEKWQKAINLVSKSTLPDVWQRHVLDSYQILDTIKTSSGIWIDLGSGAGFPALVVAICSDFDVHVVESDQRKCLFMREVSRETSTPLTVHNSRIEKITPFSANVISARALASVEKLLDYAEPFATEKTEFCFLKGQDVDVELTNAAKCWNITAEKNQSLTSKDGCILKLENVRRL